MITIKARSVLIVVDMQNDFMVAGALPVPGADSKFVKSINELASNFDRVIVTQDWHPVDHISFNIWPNHCIQNTFGAELDSELHVNPQMILRKGWRKNIDSYSAFIENDQITHTGLAGYLQDTSASSIVICGLALDFCVKATAIDGYNLRFPERVIVAKDYTLPVFPNQVEAVYDELHKKGVWIQ